MAATLTEDDHAALASSIRRAEAGTAGEIRVVLATRPLVSHPFFALMWTALLALVLPWPLAFLPGFGVAELLSAQAAAFALVGALLFFTPLGGLVVPRRAIERAARAAAIDHFLALGMARTQRRTGVLILVAVPDRIVEVVADEAIHMKVGHGAWQDVCAAVLTGAREGRLADGLKDGIDAAGRLLAAHVPGEAGDLNELPDRVVVL